MKGIKATVINELKAMGIRKADKFGEGSVTLRQHKTNDLCRLLAEEKAKRNQTLYFLLYGYCVVARPGGVLVGQTVQHIDRRYRLYKLYYRVVRVSEYHLVPFHRRARRQNLRESNGWRKSFHTVLFGSVYLGYSSKRCFYVAVARSLAAPRTAVYHRLVVYDAHNRVVVVHKVATLNMLKP